MALPASIWRRAPATFRSPGCPRTAARRGSKGPSLPAAASTESAPATSAAAGSDEPLDGWMTQLAARDRKDTERALSPLQVAPGAVRIDTTRLSESQVVQRILEAVRS